MRITDESNSITFPVRVIPRSSRSAIVGEHDGALKVKLASPPVDGAANDELIRLLSKAFEVPKNDIEIIAGHASKSKLVRLTGADSVKIHAVLHPKS